jgi:1-deoxy-D-xylulose-5-phosphate synthase
MLKDGRFPEDLKGMSADALESLAEEIRQEIVSTCLRNGGHLGASLGAVEIAIALHRIFDSPEDKIVWDVGHQAYAHKLLTGRADRFGSIRTGGGLSGFLSREESEHDAFGAGHSSTALSAALGFAYRSETWTVAVVGDGGLTAGIAYEALNNIQSPNEFGPLLIVLNDNQMSISENVGGIHHLLSNGQGADFFQLFGLEYVGPLNGHDLPTMLAALNGIRTSRPDRPVILHLLTQKGKGYSPAEARPQAYHGVGPAQSSAAATAEKIPSDSEAKAMPAPEKTWSDHFGEAMVRIAEKDPKLLAISAAMIDGTGLVPFQKRFADRTFDVGIAEPHAVTFSAGLAANGWKPVCAIYSTFLQRGFDGLVHDVCIQKLPVVFAADRAGLVGADGPTHHGVFDLALANAVPGISVFVPEIAGDLEGCLRSAVALGAPALVRYPRGKAPADPSRRYAEYRIRGADGSARSAIGGARRFAITFGPCGTRVAKILAALPEDARKEWLHVSVLRLKPFPADLLSALLEARPERLVIFEEGVERGGFASWLATRIPGARSRVFAYPDRFVPHGTTAELDASIGWTDEAIRSAFLEK